MSIKLCECGCGNPTPIAKRDHKTHGWKKGQPIRFINGHRSRMVPKREKSPQWKGGIIKHNGMILKYDPDHKRAMSNGYVNMAIYKAEKVLGKPLPPKAEMHHFDENRLNNNNINLIICENHEYHMFLHQRIRALMACGKSNYRKCRVCKKYDAPENLFNIKKNAAPYHKECINRVHREYYAKKQTPRFPMTYCSQCGQEFGPGDHGYSHCESHRKGG